MPLRLRLLFALLVPSALFAQEAAPTAETVENYNAWGWDAVVMRNGLITVATVPEIGARIMQYDLAEHPSIFVNEAEIGQQYTPAEDAPWRNYGGYKVWPAPQSEWNWPPPPILDGGVYEGFVESETPDSATTFVSSAVEQWQTPGLRFERRATIYAGTSRVRVEQTIVNEGESAQQWSVWDVTQQIVNHPGEEDFDHFWVYFPLNPDSRYGPSGVRLSTPNEPSEAFRGEVAPGVYGVQFRPANQKIFADSPAGWIAYVDERDGYVYAKTFDLVEDAPYPDEGAHVEVWINQDPLYLEVEVVSPVVELAPNGGRYTFIEDWWAARMNGPVRSVNRTGAVAEPLHVSAGRDSLTATYGVFHVGTARAVFLDGNGEPVGEGASHAVTPLESFELREAVTIPETAASVELRVFDPDGALIGALETARAPGSAGPGGNGRAGTGSKRHTLFTTDALSAVFIPALFKAGPQLPHPMHRFSLLPILRTYLLALGIGGLVTATGCDFLAGVVGLDTREIELGSFAEGILIRGGTAQTIDDFISTEDLPGIVDGVESFKLEAEHLTYTPVPVETRPEEAPKTAGVAASGQVDLVLVVNGIPATGGTITIVDDAVTDIDPSKFDVGSVDLAAVREIYNAIPEPERPVLSDFEDLTEKEIENRVNDAVESSGFDLIIMLRTTGTLHGYLTITAVEIDAQL